jgi:hypothetical protein
MWHHCRAWGGGERERFRCDTASFTQGDHAVPAFVGNGIVDLFVVVATIGQHPHLTPIVGTDIVFYGERAQGCHHALMFALIREIMRLAIPLAIEGNRRQGHQHVTQNHDDSGQGKRS